MNLINKGDFLEACTKLKQRGLNYFLKKANLDPRSRTQSTFNPAGADGSNWWIIPEVKSRENERIAGDPEKTFDAYLAGTYFQNKDNLKLLSVGCGVGNREIKLAESGHFSEVLGIDLSRESIQEANRKVEERGLSNIRFEQTDFYLFNLRQDYYDVVLFYSSLHHFKAVEQVAERVGKTLKNDGMLILNEYVGKNRLQFAKEQLQEMNRLLGLIPEKYKTRFLTNRPKSKIYAPGLLRMIVSDPSEAVESESILPVVHRKFEVLEEKKTGGDLLMMVLKDIAHHFVNVQNQESQQILKRLFREEDEYLEKIENPDFIFGAYRKRD